jgi:hypothetical protein
MLATARAPSGRPASPLPRDAVSELETPRRRYYRQRGLALSPRSWVKTNILRRRPAPARADAGLLTPTTSACEHAQSPLRAELSHHLLGHLVGVELATIGKLQNPDRDELDNGGSPRQPRPGACLPEGAVHRVDLVSGEGWRTALRVIAQLEVSLYGASLVPIGSAGHLLQV